MIEDNRRYDLDTGTWVERYDTDMGRVVGVIPGASSMPVETQRNGYGYATPGVERIGIEPPYGVQDNESILQEAHRLTHGDRNTTYGEPYDDYKCVGRVLGAQLEKWLRSEGFDINVPDVPPHVAANFMASGVKGCRLAQKTAKRDSFVDQAGYSDVGYRSYVRQTETAPAQRNRNAEQAGVVADVKAILPHVRLKHSTK